MKGLRPLRRRSQPKISCAGQVPSLNLDYQFKIESVDGNPLHISGEIKGTHAGSLELMVMHMGVISATNKDFSTTTENHTITVKNEKVSSWVVEPTEGAGLTAILKQLDVKLSKL